jgi:hypothetical protein
VNAYPLIILCLLLCAGCATSSEKYESAAHNVLHKDGKVEIRKYDSLRLAGTTISNSERSERNAAFMRLFRYITGANENATEIAMTIPVFMSRGDEERMSFVLPKDLDAPPKAKDPKVFIREESLGHVAVLSFSGRAKDAQVTSKERELREWLIANGLTGQESWLAVYNEPWIPGPLRHNEVLIRLATSPERVAKFASVDAK